MAEENKSHNEACESKCHSEHLCYMIATSWHLRNKEQFKKIVNGAEYRCLNCDRTAKNEKNLCEPESL